MAADPHKTKLDRLRGWRNRAEPDRTLKFVVDHVEKNVVKPHKQLGDLSTAWGRLVPPAIARRATLKGLVRGLLTVHVPDSSTHYELDRLLRGGLEQRLRAACKTTLRKVAVKVVGGQTID
jgi:hypothetical protein